VALLALNGLMRPAHPATAAPLALPTPATDVLYSPGATSILTFWTNSARTSDGCSPWRETRDVELVDLHWTVDVSDTNTTTLSLEFTNWASGANEVQGETIESAIVADANDLQPFLLFGRFTRVCADVTNSETITVSAIGKGK
jgi:hypothetical protein